MKIGDLVEITSRGGVLYAGKVGVITGAQAPSMMFPHMVLSVTCLDGNEIDGITQAWVKVLDESR